MQLATAAKRCKGKKKGAFYKCVRKMIRGGGKKKSKSSRRRRRC